MAIPQAATILLINPLDANDLIHENPGRTKSSIGLFYYAFEQQTEPRAIGTPRQVKGIHPHPAYYYNAKKDTNVVSRGSFLLRQFAIFVWQYAVLDIVQFSAHRMPVRSMTGEIFTELEWNVPIDIWIQRITENLISWFLIARICLDCRYRMASIIVVGLGINSPQDWSPIFGSMSDAYTLRNYWGTFWHQGLRQALTSVSNLVTRDIMHLPRPSLLERYTNIFLVFFASGVLHLVTDIVMGIPAQYSGAILFFTSFVLGFMIEDCVQALYKRIKGPEVQIVSKWKRVIGYLWVATWLGIVSTVHLFPGSQRIPPHELRTVPYRICDRVGIAPVAGFTVVGGLALLFGYKVEI
ncbi:uncharacterized protein N7484_008413 [Penicillium longicatenatum]|uniref:uncharacterized protein n=1 Tax=Penicillium longicatenatum TaxID=1561947 RepID=UPI002548B236|nr:uncharacterized protein N7484_008413 [Penicillium longicatenatum]KAJ5635100.1 hypothetical protein N7484_008413 [Penicillium longicatenatum]